MNVTQYTRPRRATAAAVAALTTTLALAAGCWVVSIRQVNGMGMGTATRLGPLALAMAGFGLLILIAPGLVPGLTPPM
jgi:hypothetical protein